MKYVEYTVLTEKEYLEASENGESVEVFATLQCLFDVYGEDVEYLEVTYYDYDNLQDNDIWKN